MKLLKKKYRKYAGKVYDIGVSSKDHTYGVNGVTVHNSAGGCLVSYLLGITKLDPLKYNLLFERFLNAGRVGYWKDETIMIVELEDGRTIEINSEKKLPIYRGDEHMNIQAQDLKVEDDIICY